MGAPFKMENRVNKRTQTLMCALALLLFSSFGQAANDSEALQNLAQEFVSAWNRHDAKALAAFWTADGDLLSPWADVIAGQKEIEKHFADENLDKTKAASIQLTIQNIRMIDPETAFLDTDYTISGMTVAGIKADPFHGHAVFVLVKRDGLWKILIARAY